MSYPDRLFVNGLPAPPSWSAASKTAFRRNQSIAKAFGPPPSSWTSDWKDVEADSLYASLSRFQQSLRSVHKHKIVWPEDESSFSSLVPADYLLALLRPIPSIYNQLHSPSVLETPMECRSLEFDEPLCGVTFSTPDFTREGVVPPIVMALPEDLFDSDSPGKVSDAVEYAISAALKHDPDTPSIILTNLKDIIIVNEEGYEKVCTTQFSLAFRAVSAACLHAALSSPVWMGEPKYETEIDESVLLPGDPPQNPNQPLLPDEDVFATHHRNSDFDRATLVRDREKALQFLRWRDHMRDKHPQNIVTHPGDLLVGQTNQTVKSTTGPPLFPYDPSELPAETISHVEAVRRPPPLDAGMAENLKQSKSFGLEIESVMAAGSLRGTSTVYRCKISSIDGTPTSSPSLCLKLFDDRFQLLANPNGDRPKDVQESLRYIIVAELEAIDEGGIYNKLQAVQGTVIPWFYGVHTFRLPDGIILHGILMEYIEGWHMNSESAKSLGRESQGQLIQSCRHAVRVLDVADVSQRDWHSGQILCYTHPKTKEMHAVLIDFSMTTQCFLPEDRNPIENYIGAFQSLLEQGSALDPELVWEHFGLPDSWDPLTIILPVPKGKGFRRINAQTLFPFISFS